MISISIHRGASPLKSSFNLFFPLFASEKISGRFATTLTKVERGEIAHFFQSFQSKESAAIFGMFCFQWKLFANEFRGFQAPQPHNLFCLYRRKLRAAKEIRSSVCFGPERKMFCKSLKRSRLVKWCEFCRTSNGVQRRTIQWPSISWLFSGKSRFSPKSDRRKLLTDDFGIPWPLYRPRF